MNWKNNRPEGWLEGIKILAYFSVSPEIYDEQEVQFGRKCFIRGMEAGADAILEWLKKQGRYCPTGYITEEIAFGNKWVSSSGYLTFIPEEKGE